jgi:hypothetical protein
MKLANAFNTEWNILGSSHYEIEHFPLPFENVSSLNLDHYKLFLSSDHVNFWKKMVPAIMLTDTGIVYMLSKRYRWI